MQTYGGYGQPAYGYQVSIQQSSPSQRFHPPEYHQRQYLESFQQQPAVTTQPHLDHGQYSKMQAGSSTCYNCGAVDHWAQYCPLPRRPTPAGSHTNGPRERSFKRPKPGGAVVTRYAPPPPPPPLPHAAVYGHPAPSYGPPTPMSANSPTFTPWPQQAHPVYGQTASQNYYQGQIQPPHNPYASPGLPTPITPQHAYFPSPVSMQGFHPHQRNFGHSPPLDRAAGNHSRPFSPPHQGSPSSSDVQTPRRSFSSTRTSDQSPQAPSTNLKRGAAHLSPRSDAVDSNGELSLEDLADLDFPDEGVPKSAPIRVCRPLSGKCTDPDSFGHLAPVSEDENVCISKYFRYKDSLQACKGVRQSADWVFLKGDPIFRPLDTASSDLVQLYQLRERRDWHQEDRPHRARVHRKYSSSVDHSQNYRLGQKRSRDELDREIESDMRMNSAAPVANARSASTTTCQGSPPAPKESTEEILARLGVTGAPKPVTVGALIARTGDPQRGRTTSHGPNSRRRSRSPRSSDSLTHSQSPLGEPSQSKSSGYRERDPLEPSPRSDKLQSKRVQEPDRRRPGQGKHSPTDGIGSNHDAHESHRLDARSNVRPLPRDEIDDARHRRNPLQSDAKSMSPPERRTSRSSDRGRAARRSHDDETSKPLHRTAVDEAAPKSKRRLPVVAAAYSRRW